MNGDKPLIYRLLLAVDIQAYSRRNAREQLLAQWQLDTALQAAAAGVGLDRDRWLKQVGGDGELATLPEGVEAALVAGEFVVRLAAALREANQSAERGGHGARGGHGDGATGEAPPRLRIRLALHHGTLTEGPFGPAGDAPIVVQRLLDADPLRRLLADDPGRDLVYIVSDTLYDDVVRTGFVSLPATGFEPVEVTAKGTVFRGHIFTGRIGGAARPRGQGGSGDGSGDGPATGARVLDFPALLHA
ncbi:hypothetical protein [Actinomadura hibisca]|uniref:hypothetical protein n=1 Tax=Actinomadura hibisca TaxID=68565 RepID=UPI0008342F05|nr:hypothetical protein [Actinomadura hibisca]